MRFQKITKNQFSNTFKLVFCASMLSVSTLFAVIGTFARLPFFAQMSLDVDLSLVFIVPVIFVCSLAWALGCGVLNALIHFTWNPTNWIGILILMFSNVLVVFLFWVFAKALGRSKKRRETKTKWVYSWLLTILCASFAMSALNGILFTPLYWWWLAPGLFNSISFVRVGEIYDADPNLHVYLLGIPNYWAGIFGLYGLFNVTKFAIVAFFSVPVLMFFKKHIVNAVLF